MSEKIFFNISNPFVNPSLRYSCNVAQNARLGTLGGISVRFLSNSRPYVGYQAPQSYYASPLTVPFVRAARYYVGPQNTYHRYSVISDRSSDFWKGVGSLVSLFFQKPKNIYVNVEAPLKEKTPAAQEKIPAAEKNEAGAFKGLQETCAFKVLQENLLVSKTSLKTALDHLIRTVEENPNFRANLGSWFGRYSTDNQNLDRCLQQAFVNEESVKDSVAEILKLIEKGLIQSGLAKQVGEELMIPELIDGEPNLVFETYNQTVQSYNKFVELYDIRKQRLSNWW